MLHDKLRELRIEYEVPQTHLAEFMRVDIASIQAWEKGIARPNDEQQKRLASLFHITVAELQDDSKRKTQGNPQPQTKTQQKIKTKKKKKVKHVHRRRKKAQRSSTKKRRRVWPLVVIVLLLIAIAGAGVGYLYWRYGDAYEIVKKNTNSDTSKEQEVTQEPEIAQEEELSWEGVWKDASSTLTISSMTQEQVTFTLVCTNPEDSSQTAVLRTITGARDGSQVTFTFTEDGFGNRGSGTMQLGKDQIQIQITLDQTSEGWHLPESLTLTSAAEEA